MTTILENNCDSIYQYSQEQFEVLEQFDRSNNNTLRKDEVSIDHCSFQIYEDTFILILHGSKEGKVFFNDLELSLPELEVQFRQEQNLSPDHDIIIKLVCCHDGYIGSYLSDHCWIISSFYTKDTVSYELFKTSDGYYSQFIDMAKIREALSSSKLKVKKSLTGLL